MERKREYAEGYASYSSSKPDSEAWCALKQSRMSQLGERGDGGSLTLPIPTAFHYMSILFVPSSSPPPCTTLSSPLAHVYMPPPTKSQLKRSSAAVAAFHNHFSKIYGHERWHNSLYPALLAPTRHAALLNSTETSLTGDQVPFLSLPCFQRGGDTFPHPTDNSYYLLDAASVLAVQALDVQPDHKVLDLCAAPGGKSIAIAQKAFVYANESDRTRYKRLEGNLEYHLAADRFKVSHHDGTRAPLETYDRILVDAPCSSERHIIHAHAKKAAAGHIAEEMLNWKPSQTLPKTQLALLMTALRAVKTGGKVVYATCSISNEENDCVIERSLQAVRKEKWTVDLEDEYTLDNVTEKTKYGRIVLPNHPSGGGWGPLFFAVIQKVERLTP